MQVGDFTFYLVAKANSFYFIFLNCNNSAKVICLNFISSSFADFTKFFKVTDKMQTNNKTNCCPDTSRDALKQSSCMSVKFPKYLLIRKCIKVTFHTKAVWGMSIPKEEKCRLFKSYIL